LDPLTETQPLVQPVDQVGRYAQTTRLIAGLHHPAEIRGSRSTAAAQKFYLQRGWPRPGIVRGLEGSAVTRQRVAATLPLSCPRPRPRQVPRARASTGARQGGTGSGRPPFPDRHNPSDWPFPPGAFGTNSAANRARLRLEISAESLVGPPVPRSTGIESGVARLSLRKKRDFSRN
jgi:hypothetical protein